MQSRIFVSDQSCEAINLQILKEWCVSKNGTYTTEYITDEALVESGDPCFVTVTIEYPEGEDDVPYFDEYTPFYVTRTLDPLDVYDSQRSELDCIILTNLCSVHVVTANTVQTSRPYEVSISYFLDNGVPLWISPSKWEFLAKQIQNTAGMAFVTSSALMHIAVNIARVENVTITVTKHPKVDVWYCESKELEDNVSHIDVIMTNMKAFSIEKPRDGSYESYILGHAIAEFEFKEYTYQTMEYARELGISKSSLRAVEYTFDLPAARIFFAKQSEEDPEWLQTVMYYMLKGEIPEYTMRIPDDGSHVAAVRHAAIVAYIKACESTFMGTSRGVFLLTQDFIMGIKVSKVGDFMEIRYKVNSKEIQSAFQESFGSADSFYAVQCESPEKALIFRYQLSECDVPSMCHDNVVTWDKVYGDDISEIPTRSDLIGKLNNYPVMSNGWGNDDALRESYTLPEYVVSVARTDEKTQKSQTYGPASEAYCMSGVYSVGPIMGIGMEMPESMLASRKTEQLAFEYLPCYIPGTYVQYEDRHIFNVYYDMPEGIDPPTVLKVTMHKPSPSGFDPKDFVKRLEDAIVGGWFDTELNAHWSRWIDWIHIPREAFTDDGSVSDGVNIMIYVEKRLDEYETRNDYDSPYHDMERDYDNE